MRIETPELTLGPGGYWSAGGRDWLCDSQMRSIFGPINPSATIKAVATRRKSKDAVRFTWQWSKFWGFCVLFGPQAEDLDLLSAPSDLLDDVIGCKDRVLWIKVVVLPE